MSAVPMHHYTPGYTRISNQSTVSEYTKTLKTGLSNTPRRLQADDLYAEFYADLSSKMLFSTRCATLISI